MTDESKLKAEFLEKLANPNKEKILKQMEAFVEEYNTLVKLVSYVSFDSDVGIHNLLLVTGDTLSEMVNSEFMDQMNKAIPGSSVKDAIQDKANKTTAYVIRVYE